MRASDADREHVVEALRDAYSQGRLTEEEFSERVETAYKARTYGELGRLTNDLPGQDLRDLARRPAPVRGEVVGRAGGPPAKRSVAGIWRAWIAVTLVTSTIWLLTAISAGLHGGEVDNFWPIWPIGILGAIALFRTIAGPRR
jgi:hypothetical protein